MSAWVSRWCCPRCGRFWPDGVTHCLDCGTAGAGLPRRWQRSSFVPRGMAAQRGGDFSLFGRDYGW